MAEKVLVSFEVDNKGAIKAVKQFRGELDETPKSTAKVATGLGDMQKALGAIGFAYIAKEAMQFAATMVRVGVDVGLAALKTADSFNTMKMQLTALRGSSTQAEGDFKWILEFAKNTPLQLEQVTASFNKMVAYGIEPTSGAMQSLVDMSFKYGDGAGTLESAILALGKAWGKGKMEAEEWNMMAERGIPIGRMMADMLGVDEAALFKMRREGKFTRDVIQDLLDYMGGDAAGAAAARMDTLSGKVSNLQDTMTQWLGELGGGAAMEGAKQALDELAGILADLEKAGTLEALSTAFGVLTMSIAGLLNTLRTHGKEIGVLAEIAKTIASFTPVSAAAINALDSLTSGMNTLSSGTADAALAMYDMGMSLEEVIAVMNGYQLPAERMIELIQQQGTETEDLGDTTKTVFTEMADKVLLTTGQHGPFYVGFANIKKWGDESFLSVGKQFVEVFGPSGQIQRLDWATAIKGGFEEMPDWAKDASEGSADIMSSTFADMLGKGFTGALESFADLWDEIWEDLAKSMTGALTAEFENWMNGVASSEGGDANQGLFSRFKDVIEGDKLGAAMGGVGMMYGGFQQGGAAGMAQGAMGGAMAGAVIGLNPALMAATGGMSVVIGAVVGAIVGAAAAYFGGPTRADSSGTVSMTGGRVTGTSGQELGEGMWAQFSQDRVNEYRAAVIGMNDVLRLFGDGALFDMIGDAPTWSFSGRGTLSDFATIFREQWLPEAMRQMFGEALGQGLGDLGMTDESIDQLFSELQGLGTGWIPGLHQFVAALVGTVDLLGDMDWNTIMDESRMDSFSTFMAGMAGIVDAVQIQMLGIGDMSLLERGAQAVTIEGMIRQARQAEIQMLQQIHAMQMGINRSIDQTIEGLQTGGMSDVEKRQYYEQQIIGIMGKLRGGVGSPEELQLLMSDLMRYVGLMQGALGDQLYDPTSPFGGETWSDYLIGILGEARGLSDIAFAGFEDAIRETNDLLIAQLQLLIDALTDFTGALTGDGDPTQAQAKNINIPVEVTVNIASDKSMFVQEVRAIVNAEINSRRRGATAPHGVSS